CNSCAVSIYFSIRFLTMVDTRGNILMLAVFSTLLKRFAAACDPGSSFFGLPRWYEYLDGENDALGKCVPTVNNGADIWLIVLAVIDALLRVSAVVAVGFVVYGGIQFIVSQGEPDKTNQARNTIINAMVGLVISMVASAITSFIGNQIQ